MIAKRLTSWVENASLPVWILLVVALVDLMLCGGYHEQRWDRAIVPKAWPAEHAGEGLVIQWNGLGYYAWLRSLLIDRDWDFDNEFDEHNPHHHYVPPPKYRTPLDRRANQWSVGPACIWAVTVAPAHFVVRAGEGTLWPWQADGYSLLYQLVVGATSLAVAFLGLGFLYGLCRTQARPARAALATALLTLGTTIVYYSAIEISLPHGLGAAVLAAGVWYWLTTYGSPRPGRWFLVGVLIGAAALMRWQLATFAVLPVVEWLMIACRRRRVAITHATLFATGAILTFSPQLIAWRYVYGSWIVNPIQGVRYHWLTPSLWEILCSEDRSLFYWTPVTMLAFIGAVACLKRTNASVGATIDTPFGRCKEPLWILLAAFVIQVYAVGGIWGQGEMLQAMGTSAGVFLARSYGFRDLTESLIVLAPGLAWLLEHAKRWAFRVLAAVGLGLISWNLLLVDLYTNQLVPSHDGANLFTLITQASTLIRDDPLVLLQVLQGPILLAVLLGFATAGQSETPGKSPRGV